MSYQAKRITIFVLILLTIMLAAFAFFIIQQLGTTPGGGDTPVGDVPGNCTVKNNSGSINGCITVEKADNSVPGQNSCISGSVKIYKFSRPMKGPNDDCFTSDNQFLQWPNAELGKTYCASELVQSCECVQIDYRNSAGQDVGVKAGKWDASCTTCGAYCEGTGQSWCATGNTCVNNKCVLNQCATNPASCNADLCTVKVLKQCGATCTGTGQGDCQSGFVCNNNVCKLPTCATNPELCNADLCSTKAVCGQPGFIPGPGQCANPGTPTCDAQCRPISENVICGQTCGAGKTCSDGSVCDPTKNLCVIQQCVGRSDCTNNGCKLPESAIFNDERDYVVYGIMLMLLGFISYKYSFLQKTLLLGLNAYDFMTDRSGRKTKSKITKQRDNFEKRFGK